MSNWALIRELGGWGLLIGWVSWGHGLVVGYESDTVAYFTGMSWGFMRNTSIMAGTNKYAIKTIVKRIIHSLHTYTTVDKIEANESLLYRTGSPT